MAQATTYADYWRGFLEYCVRAGATLPPFAVSPRYYQRIPLGPGFAVSLLASRKVGYLRCELYLDGPDAPARFEALLQDATTVEAQLGPLDWTSVPGRQGQHIVLAGPTFADDLGSREAEYGWLREQAERFSRAFDPYVEALGRA